jgi:hypothetical protein
MSDLVSAQIHLSQTTVCDAGLDEIVSSVLVIIGVSLRFLVVFTQPG